MGRLRERLEHALYQSNIIASLRDKSQQIVDIHASRRGVLTHRDLPSDSDYKSSFCGAVVKYTELAL